MDSFASSRRSEGSSIQRLHFQSKLSRDPLKCSLVTSDIVPGLSRSIKYLEQRKNQRISKVIIYKSIQRIHGELAPKVEAMNGIFEGSSGAFERLQTIPREEQNDKSIKENIIKLANVKISYYRIDRELTDNDDKDFPNKIQRILGGFISDADPLNEEDAKDAKDAEDAEDAKDAEDAEDIENSKNCCDTKDSLDLLKSESCRKLNSQPPKMKCITIRECILLYPELFKINQSENGQILSAEYIDGITSQIGYINLNK